MGKLKPNEITQTDISKLKFKTIIEAILELNQFNELSPQTIDELNKMKHFRMIKFQNGKTTDDKKLTYDNLV